MSVIVKNIALERVRKHRFLEDPISLKAESKLYPIIKGRVQKKVNPYQIIYAIKREL